MRFLISFAFVSFSMFLTLIIGALVLQIDSSRAQEMKSWSNMITPAGLGTKSKIAAAWLFYPKYLKKSVIGSYAYRFYVQPKCKGSELGKSVGATMALVWKDDDDKNVGYTSGQLFKAVDNSSKRNISNEFKLAKEDDAICYTGPELDSLSCKIDESEGGQKYPCLFLTANKLPGINPKKIFWIDLPSFTFYETRVGEEAAKKLANFRRIQSE